MTGVQTCALPISYQVAKANLRKLESSLAHGEEMPFPTKTHLRDIVSAYVEYMRSTKTKNGFKVDLWYLRDIFGPDCLSSQKDRKRRANKRKCKTNRRQVAFLEANHLEDLTTAMIAEFIASKVQANGIAPKTDRKSVV